MKLIKLVGACAVQILNCLPVDAGEQPPVLFTPNTIRIQSLEEPTKGEWVVMQGFRELGSPTFSRDGQWIAFDAYKDGFDFSPAECWIARKDGRDLRRLTFGATPRFSPDGKRLLFVRERVNDRSHQEGVYIINHDGTGEKWIGLGRWPDWSPDGKQIVFSLGGEQIGGARRTSKICIANADGTERDEIANGDCPSWSPDGKKIAYCFREGNKLPIIRLFDMEENLTTDLGVGWYRANWLPDSKTVVCNGTDGQKSVMVRMSLKDPRKMIEQPSDYERPFSPSPSWNGKEIIFIARKPT